MEFDKSRVYTALNADELKVGDKVIVADDPIYLKTLVEIGSELSTIKEIYDGNYMCRFSVAGDDYSYNLAYLVERAGEKKWRPYENCNEMIADFKKRFNVDWADYEKPLIWVKLNIDNLTSLITDFFIDVIYMSNLEMSLEGLFNDYTYLDGSPCGIEEDE